MMNERQKEISEAFAKGNMDLATAYLADDIVWNILGEPKIVGKAEVLEVSKMALLQSFPDIRIVNVVGEGNYVIIESTGEAKTKNGMPYNQTYCDVFRFHAEKIQEITTYLDTLASKEALDDRG